MDVFFAILFQILSLLILILIIVGIVKLLRSENKNKRILGKVIIGILLAPFVIVILLFLACLVIFSGASLLHL